MFNRLLKNILFVKKKMFTSLKGTDTMILQKKNTLNQKDIPLLKKYLSINFLPVDNFNAVIKTKDYRYLLKISDYEYLPEITDEENAELEKIWVKIEEEYLKEDKQKKQEVEFELNKKILEMQNQYMILSSFVFLAGFKEEYKTRLKEFGYDIKSGNPKELDEAHKHIGGQLLNKIRIKQKELERYQLKEQENVQFEDIVDIIERHKGHYINTKELSVKRWISIKNNFIKYTKEQENARRTNKAIRNNK